MVTSDGGNDGDISFVNHVQNGRDIDLCDFSHKSEAFVLDLCLNHVTVHAGKTDCLAAFVSDQGNKTFVDLSRKHHLYNICRFFVGDAQTVYKDAFFSDFFEHFGDFRSAAVYQNHLDADQGEQYNIPHDRVFQFLVDHGISAVLYNNNFAAVFLDIGQGMYQDFRPFGICNIHVIPLLRFCSRR